MPSFRVNGEDGVSRAQGRVGVLASKLGPGAKAALYRDAGGYMVNQVIPLRFREHGPGWPAVSRGGSPLIDTGLLRQSNDWRIEGDTLVVGNTRQQARLQNRGGDVVPTNAKWLTIPGPGLTGPERRTFSLRNFAGVFFVQKDGETLLAFQRVGRAVRLLATLKKKVTIKERKFLFWGREALSAITARWRTKLLAKGTA